MNINIFGRYKEFLVVLGINRKFVSETSLKSWTRVHYLRPHFSYLVYALGDQLFNREPRSALSLGSVGSRRTVYLSEDDTGSVTPASQTNDANPANPPLLVYNRISTVIGKIMVLFDRHSLMVMFYRQWS